MIYSFGPNFNGTAVSFADNQPTSAWSSNLTLAVYGRHTVGFCQGQGEQFLPTGMQRMASSHLDGNYLLLH